MAAKYAIGQRVRVELGKEPHLHPRYASLQPYQGKRGTIVARREGASPDGDDAGGPGESYLYEVRLRMHGNVILTLGENALVAVRR